MAFKRFIILVFFLFLAILINVYAEEKKKDKDEFELEEVVITATRTEINAAVAPGDISIITSKDIEKRNIQTVDQALDIVPGVYNTRTKMMDIAPQITLRGMPAALGRTLILIDGINLVDPMLGNTYGLAGLASEDVRKIEIVKGPFSSLYGGQAMGGVVNVITKMPEEREISFNSGYGSSWNRGEAMDDLWRIHASYGDKFYDKLSVFLSYGRNETDGFPTIYNTQSLPPTAGITGWIYTTDPTGTPKYLIGNKGDTSWWDDNFSLKTALDLPNSTKLNFSYYRTRFQTHYDDPNTFLRDDAGNPVWSYGVLPMSTFFNYHDMKREQEYYKLSYETKLSGITTKLSLGYTDSKFGAGMPGYGSTITGGPGKGWDNPFDRYYNAELQAITPQIFNRHVFTFGMFYGHNKGQMDEYNRTNWKDESTTTNLTYRSKGKDKTYALFVQDELSILNNLTAYIGLREDWWKTYEGSVFQEGLPFSVYNSISESSFSPKLALVYTPTDGTTLRASAGKAFRAPTIVELYRTYTSPDGTIYQGSSDLKPETTSSWDIGVEHGIWKGAKIKLSYFENYLKDLIYRGMTTPTLYENKNAGEAESKGIEFEIEQDFENGVRLFANYTYTDSKITKNSANPTIVGKKITFLPENLFNIGADITRGPFTASIVGRYVDKVFKNDNNSDVIEGVYGSYDSYFISDVKVSYAIMKNMSIALSVNNLFDEDYFSSDKAPGRSWFSELMIRF